MTVKFLLVFINASGEMDVTESAKKVTKAEYEKDVHFDKVEDEAIGAGYKGPMVAFEQGTSNYRKFLINR